MSTALVDRPQVLHAVPGRVRVHVPDWLGGGPEQLEARLHQVPGVRRAQANSLTGNILIQFDPQGTDERTLLQALGESQPTGDPTPHSTEARRASAPPPQPGNGRQVLRRARLPVRGLDRDAEVARRAVERLERYPGVRARPNPLTGRVLVEYDERQVRLEQLRAELAGLELPDLLGEDRPDHPLAPGPLVQSTVRTLSAALGFGWLALRRLTGPEGQTGLPGAATAAGVVNILQAFPFIRNSFRLVVGQDTADLLLDTSGIVAQALAGSPLGLTLAGAQAFRLLTLVRARRTAWRRYEEGLEAAPAAYPGAKLRREAGERSPLDARVLEGTGTALGHDGLPLPLTPGIRVPAGAPLFGGPFLLELGDGPRFVPAPRPVPCPSSAYAPYLWADTLFALVYAAATTALTGSLRRTFQALLLVSPRTAVIGSEAANQNAAARVLRAGVTIVGTRKARPVRLPGVLLIDGPRTLTDGLEVAAVLPLAEGYESSEVLALAGGVSEAAGLPWGRVFPRAGRAPATEGNFDGKAAAASLDGVEFGLRPAGDQDVVPPAAREEHRGDYLLLLENRSEGRPLALLALRPRLAPGAEELVRVCHNHGVECLLLPGADPQAGQALGRRTGLPLLETADAVEEIRRRQKGGAVVAFLSDNAHAGAAFSVCDLGIGLASARTGPFPARADLLAPDLTAVAAVIEAGAGRERAVRDSIGLAILDDVVGVVWSVRGSPGVANASQPSDSAAVTALVDAWWRSRGGERPGSAFVHLPDPRPERWGRREVAEVLHSLDTSEAGLTTAQAAERQRQLPLESRRWKLLDTLLDQLRSPEAGILAGAGVLSLLSRNPFEAGIIGGILAVNASISAWQEHQAGQAVETLQRLGTASARVLRDGHAVTVAPEALVPGDLLLLTSGDRVAADARLLDSQGLEVDEATLTGESLPVSKQIRGGSPEGQVVLEGSDIVAGTGRAVVFAVGRNTRLGVVAAALQTAEAEHSPLGTRMERVLQLALPVAVAASGLVVLSGFVRGLPLVPQLTAAASLAVAVIPESLPVLAATGEVGVARRLLKHKAHLRRLAAVEALGRVDVACTDKTGTLTEGRLALTLVADARTEANELASLGPELRDVLLAAALASPHPDVAHAAHPTDGAVLQGARVAGLDGRVRAERRAEAPFNPVRAFYAALVGERLYAKGAPEVLIARCSHIRRSGTDRPLEETDRQVLVRRAASLAGRGLRVLLVAEGPADRVVDDPHGLTALGFVGISDPLRPTAREAVRRCREAGVRVLMITGDHPATARTIAHEAGLFADGDQEVLTGTELAELTEDALDERLERAIAIARATPLDKLRIIEGLKRRGHTVAMTGDGVNDAPALRLADVGVAMGRTGTEVARHAADLVLADDNFATLVEALVEGRGFWGNMRRSLACLLGGNLAELTLISGASILGFATPLNPSQILTVNLLTDALPNLAVILQRPEHRNLAGLAREGTAALDATLRRDVLRRGVATALPTLAAFLWGQGRGSLEQARALAFGTVTLAELAQTLDVGWTEGRLSGSVLGAVSGSGAALAASLFLPGPRTLLGMATPTAFGLALIGAGGLSAVALNRLLRAVGYLLPAAPGLGMPSTPAAQEADSRSRLPDGT